MKTAVFCDENEQCRAKGQILYVEDNLEIQRVLSQYFIDEYDVTPALTLEEAYALFKNPKFDLILLDFSLPDGNALELCRRLREESTTQFIPIIFLSALGDIENKVKALKLGADDYLVKPVDWQELSARFHSQIQKRRIRSKERETLEFFEFSNLEFFTLTQRVTVKRNKLEPVPLPLTRTEFKLLMIFATEPSRILNSEGIKKLVWADSDYVAQKTIEVHVSNLNKKLLRGGSQVSIRYVGGAGYRFEDEASQPFSAELPA